MTLTVEPFAVRHVRTIATPAQGPALSSEAVAVLVRGGPAQAVRGNDGRTYAIFGYFVTQDRPHVASAWSLIGRGSVRAFVRIDRAVRRMLAECKLPRVEFLGCERDPSGLRWLDMLGFQFEARVDVDGAQYLNYVKESK